MTSAFIELLSTPQPRPEQDVLLALLRDRSEFLYTYHKDEFAWLVQKRLPEVQKLLDRLTEDENAPA